MSSIWDEFYSSYLDEETDLPSRLNIVKGYIKDILNDNSIINVVSICGGKSFDILESLKDNQKLYIIDNDKDAEKHVSLKQFNNVNFLLRDAQESNSYEDLPQANLLICSGFIGSITSESISDFIVFLRQIIYKGSKVVWTIKNENLDHLEFVLGEFIKHDFKHLSIKKTTHNRFSCIQSEFVGDPDILKLNKKIMNMSW